MPALVATALVAATATTAASVAAGATLAAAVNAGLVSFGISAVIESGPRAVAPKPSTAS